MLSDGFFSSRVHRIESECQRCIRHAVHIIDEKLQNLDAMYNERRHDLTSMQHLSTDEKLILFQKNIEMRTRDDAQQQVHRRTTTIEHVRDVSVFRWNNFVNVKQRRYATTNDANVKWNSRVNGKKLCAWLH
jgi:hypothetical protein